MNGLLLASQVRDQLVLVPRWQSQEPGEARRWFMSHWKLPAAIHAPLIALGLLSAVRDARAS
ncbi:MAG TPA: hypothetical protein VKJ07_00750, partial [Mycobacteriales bacterium]|nr:hypothetical protein [Mycobacteriales bacterium]